MSPEPLWQDRRPTPLGTMLVVWDRQGALRALDWSDHEDRMHRLSRGTVETRPGTPPAAIADALDAYFAGELAAIDALPVAAGGTPFQRTVWAALRTIPAGTTTSYGALAARIGQPAAMRAVGLANGANPVGIVVPCHRVIGRDGSLTGYGGGLERKRWLLRHEGALLA